MEDKQRVILVGAGGNCEAILDILADTPYTPLGILDAQASRGSCIAGIPVLGTDDAAPELLSQGIRFAIVTLTTPCALRRKVVQRYKSLGFVLPSLVSRHAFVSSLATLHEGVAVFPGANIGAGASLGDFATVNANAVVAHGVVVGSFTHIAPNATLLGSVKVGSEVLVGAASVVLPEKTVGSSSIIGAGSVVLSDVPEGCVFAGNPAQKIKD
ncbi:MAG: NeuD/PglB/VioB family sugar acetyltransferase [Raoultibacter sp.]